MKMHRKGWRRRGVRLKSQERLHGRSPIKVASRGRMKMQELMPGNWLKTEPKGVMSAIFVLGGAKICCCCGVSQGTVSWYMNSVPGRRRLTGSSTQSI